MIGDYLNEEDFINAFHHNDRKAFSALFEEFHKELVYFAFKLINDQEEAEDTVLSAFLKLFKRSNFFPSVVNIKSFLYITVRNECYDYLSKLKTKTKSLQMYSYLHNRNDELEKTEAELVEQLARLIDKLSPRAKQVIKLRYLDRLEPIKVAEMLGISYQSVLNTTMLALNRLRELNKSDFTFLVFFIFHF